MSSNIKPTIVWVSPNPSKSTGKTFRVLLQHPTFTENAAYAANIPVEWAPEVGNAVQATTVKLGRVKTSYKDMNTGEIKPCDPTIDVAFFGQVDIIDGEEMPPTVWRDLRTKKAAKSEVSDISAF